MGLLNANSGFGVAQSSLGAVVVTKLGEMANKLFNLVLFTTVGVFVVETEVGIAAILPVFLTALCFVSSSGSHFVTS